MSENTVDGLKQRLVGAFVILSLAIIFLPMIFDKPHSVGSSSIVEIPPEPDIKPVIIKKPSKPEYQALAIDPSDNKVKQADKIAASKVGQSDKTNKVAAKKQEANKQVSQKQTEAKKVVAVAKNSVSKPISVKTAPKKDAVVPAKKQSSPTVSHLPVFKNVWMIQLGTFSNQKNAYKLRDQLRKDGFDGHTKDVVVKGKKAVRVFTGPFVNKRAAEKTKKKVDTKYKVKSLIIFFDP